MKDSPDSRMWLHRIVPKKGTKTFGLTLEKGGWTVAPVVELPKKAVTINVAKNVKGSTVQVSYALQTEIATLSYTKKPYKVGLSFSHPHKG